MALTGTPIENSLAELWSIFDFLMPQYLFNYHYFQKQYENDIIKNNDEEKTKQLKKLVTPFILRRNKKEVLTELPDKIEKRFLIEMTEEQKKVYKTYVDDVKVKMKEKDFTTDKITIFSYLTKLRQLTLDPSILIDGYTGGSGKIDVTVELVEKFIKEKSNEKITDDKFEINNDQIKLVSIGRFTDAKNFDNVPQICKYILEKGIDVKWYIIGFGGDEALIKQKIKEFDMEQHVIILGKKENPYPYIKACDIYVQPSRYEGKAVAVREAQILNKPVVITNFETSKSQLTDGFDGVIVPMDNEGCAEGICNLIKDKELQQRLIENTKITDYTNKQELEKIYVLLEG